MIASGSGRGRPRGLAVPKEMESSPTDVMPGLRATAVRFAFRYSAGESQLIPVHSIVIMAVLVTACRGHPRVLLARNHTWMRGTSPRMTILEGADYEIAQPDSLNRTAVASVPGIHVFFLF